MTVVKGVDSAWEPNAAQIATAKANGVGAWLGYCKIGNDGILHGWADATFRLVKAGGLQTAGFCSTRADQAALKARAASLGIVLISDVESSVNGGDGPHVDPALAISGAGLYGGGPRGDGTIPRHLPHNHHSYVVSDYELNASTVGRGTLSWPPHDPRPAGPCGWQYAGGTAMPWGVTDLAVYDAALFGAIAPQAEDDDMAFLATTGIRPAGETKDPHGDGAVYLVNGHFKQWISGVAAPALPQFVAAYGPVKDWSASTWALDTLIEILPSIDGTKPTVDVTALANPTPTQQTTTVTGTFTGSMK